MREHPQTADYSETEMPPRMAPLPPPAAIEQPADKPQP
jgi:hypothetical protein